jgi:hypothetical protein
MEPSPREVSPETAAVDARFLQSVEKFRSRFFRQQEIATAAYEEEQAADRREEAAVQAQLQSIQQRLQRRQLAFEAAARELREKIRETIDIIDLCANDVSTDPVSLIIKQILSGVSSSLSHNITSAVLTHLTSRMLQILLTGGNPREVEMPEHLLQELPRKMRGWSPLLWGQRLPPPQG